MSFYSRFILPTLIHCGCGAKPFRLQRQKIVPDASGVVLELGFGSGLNLPFYDPAKVSCIYALEPEEGMLARARKAARKSAIKVQVLQERAEELSLAPASVDTVLVTYALCTIPDAAAALQGARRVLKPGGRLLFCEHGLSPDPDVAKRQHAIEPLWKKLAGGCHLTRDIPALIRAGGFAVETLETMYVPSTPRIAAFNSWGRAVAA